MLDGTVSIVPGDLVEMNVFFANSTDMKFPLRDDNIGLVIAVNEANVDNRFRFSNVYYVWTSTGVVGPLFKSELTKL